jgi:hypothetical protein
VSSNGVAAVRVRCRLSGACVGAFLILQPGKETGRFGDQRPMRDWVGGSNIRVPAGQTASVPIALTPTGQRLVSSRSEYKGEVFITLKDYGLVTGFPITALRLSR